MVCYSIFSDYYNSDCMETNKKKMVLQNINWTHIRFDTFDYTLWSEFVDLFSRWYGARLIMKKMTK